MHSPADSLGKWHIIIVALPSKEWSNSELLESHSGFFLTALEQYGMISATALGLISTIVSFSGLLDSLASLSKVVPVVVHTFNPSTWEAEASGSL